MTLFTPQFVQWLQSKSVTDSSGHEHAEDSGQFTGGGGGGKKPDSEKPKEEGVPKKKFSSDADIDAHIDSLKDAPESEVDKHLESAGIPRKEWRADKRSKLNQLRYALQEELATGEGKKPPRAAGGGGRSRVNWRK